MTRIVPAVAAMFLALPLFAQSTDLSLKLGLGGTPFPGNHIVVTANVFDPGVAVADVHVVWTIPPNVELLPSTTNCTRNGNTWDCALGNIYDQTTKALFAFDMPNAAFTVGATVHSAAADPNPANDSDSITISPIDVPHLALAIASAAPLRTAQPNAINITLTNDGADAAGVTETLRVDGDIAVTSITSDSDCTQAASTITCIASTLAHGGKTTTTLNVTPGASGSQIRISGDATATGALYRPEDAHATFSATIGATSALTITGTGDDEVAPDGTIGFRFTAAHAPQSIGTATNVNVSVSTFFHEVRFASATGADCRPASADGSAVACTLPDIPQGTSATFEVRYRVPGPSQYDLFPTIRWDNPTLSLVYYGVASTIVYRPVDVTTVDDFVPGSLRAAIDEVNRGECPCRIAFRIPAPVPASGWFTLRLTAPLPAIDRASHILVDGMRQTLLTGDTNPRGPEIEINGSQTTGDGLVIGNLVEVRGLTLNGFPRHAIVVAPTNVVAKIHDNYIGTDPTGEVAVPNFRGIVTTGGNSTTIDSNVISGNRASAVFALSPVSLTGNRIGVSATGAPLGNGASGVYMTKGATLDGNTIAHNHDFAIGTAQGVAPLLGQNSMFDNGGLAVDVGMDGPMPPTTGPFALGAIARTPTVTDAAYDGTSTMIRLHIDERSNPKTPVGGGTVTSVTTLSVYETASLNRAGYAEPEHFIGSVLVDGSDATLTVAADLRGHFITAFARTARNYFAEYSETVGSELSLGRAVR